MYSLLGPAGKVQQSLCCGLPSRSSDWHVLFRWRERLSSERWQAGSRFWPVVAGSCPSRAANAGADHGGVVPGAQQVDERLWTPTRTAQAGASRATSPGAGCWGAGAVLLRPGAADHEVVEASVDAGGQAGIAEGTRVAAAEERRALEGALAGDALQAGCVKVVASRARPAGVHRHALGGGGGSGGAEEDRGRRVPWRHLNLGG